MDVSQYDLMLRSERSERLEAWAAGVVLVPTLRDAALRTAPQGEVVRDRSLKVRGRKLWPSTRHR